MEKIEIIKKEIKSVIKAVETACNNGDNDSKTEYLNGYICALKAILELIDSIE